MPRVLRRFFRRSREPCLGDPAALRLGEPLHLPAPLALVVLELTSRRAERVTQRHVGVLVSVAGGVCAADRDLLIRQRDVDAEVVQAT